MNLLGNYIIEVYNVKEKTYNYNGKQGLCVEVDLKSNCHGSEKRHTTTFLSMNEWEEAKRVGYYMAWDIDESEIL